ncbi:MAG: hypothetical protein JWN14_2468 [Chthonomonadales bacterium]|nr:hypothetical protein [Chthonomonadales bacterium]
MRQLIDRKYDGFGRFMPAQASNALYFPHTCDLWKPGPLTLDANKVALDIVYVRAATAQACKFLATPEDDEPTVASRSKVVNIFTLDRFFFPPGVSIQDTWIVKLTSGAVQDQVGAFWVCEGNPQAQEGASFHPVQAQMVYAKLTPPPNGVS